MRRFRRVAGFAHPVGVLFGMARYVFDARDVVAPSPTWLVWFRRILAVALILLAILAVAVMMVLPGHWCQHGGGSCHGDANGRATQVVLDDGAIATSAHV
jgi:hypothetical protein